MIRARLLSPILLGALAGGCARSAQVAPSPAAQISAPVTSSRQLVERMRDEYDGRFYSTLIFLQNNTRYTTTGGEDRSQWMEYQIVPGRLRVEFLPEGSGSGILFRHDTAYSFDNGKLTRTSPQIHPLLLLSADIYSLPVSRTMSALDSLNVNTGILRRDNWRGAPVHVVGAAAGDSTSTQFWVDTDDLLLRRLIHQTTLPTGRAVSTEYHFTYQEVDGVQVPEEIIFLRDGQPFWREEYTNVRVNVPLPEELFDPTRWADPPEVP